MQKASSHRLHGMQNAKRRMQNRMVAPEANSACEQEPQFFILHSSFSTLWSRLLHIVGLWLQVLFHSPNRGSFHLSLAVLVHYRLPRSI
jgi:hypothetical protein